MDQPGSAYQGDESYSMLENDSRLDRLGRLSWAALVVTVLAEECDQWTLVEATSAVVGRPVSLDVLDPVVAGGLVAVESGRVCVPDPDLRRLVAGRVLPSERQAAHQALAAMVHDEPWVSAWHATLSTQTRDPEAAELALATARILQRAYRPARARVMAEHAARLSTTSAARAACLLEAGATAFCLGLPSEAQGLVDLAERVGLDDDLVRLPRLLRATFVGSAGSAPADLADVEAAEKLLVWGLPSLYFSVWVGAASRVDLTDLMSARSGRTPPPATLVSLGAGDLPGAARLLSAECERLTAAGLRGVETHARAVLGQTAARIGDLETATRAVAEARELAWATRQPEWAAHAALTRATVAGMRGEAGALRLAGDIERAVLAGHSHRHALAELVRAVALLSADEPGDAYAMLAGLASRTARCPELLTAGLVGHLADAAVQTGRVPEARTMVSRIADTSAVCRRGAELADLLYATAVLAPDDSAESCFAVVQSLDAARWPWVRGRAELAQGAWLRRARQVGRARPHLLAAQRLFDALGAPVWQRRVHNELRAAGVKASRTGPDEAGAPGVAARLSPQELTIVQLAAEGLSNRQIADRLFLSPRTIGSHLYRIFPKLDVTSRRELVGLIP